jgi:hypothetical protein
MKTWRSLTLLAPLLVPAVAGAGADWDKDPPYDYALAERSMKDACDTFSSRFEAPEPLVCSVDRASFDRHLKAEKRKKRSLRDGNDPYLYCWAGAVVYLTEPDTGGIAAWYTGSCKEARAEFAARVKRLVCRYKEGRAGVELDKNGTLYLNVTRGILEGEAGGWISRDMPRLFPKLKVCIDD